jgi:hypothetical protein
MDRIARSHDSCRSDDSVDVTDRRHHVDRAHIDLAELAADIAARGITAVAAAGLLDPVLRVARSVGVTPTLVALVADPAAPAVARERGFGRLAAELATDRAPKPTPRRLAAA